MLKYTSIHGITPDTTHDIQLMITLGIALIFIIIMLHNLHPCDKRTTSNVETCLATYLNIDEKRFEQKLSPVRRTRSRDRIDSMV
jgi:hypothetical protein